MALQEIGPVRDNEQRAECIDNCFEAAQACEWCATASVQEADEDMVRCIELCRDVADLATLNARLMARNSNFSAELAAACAEACEECADECEQHDHEHCQICADVLRECADSCQEMASA